MASAPFGRLKPLISRHSTLTLYHYKVHSSYCSLYHTATTSRTGSRRQRGHCNKELCIVSANVRDFHTNVGKLTHKFVLPNKADLVFVSETFLDSNVPANYASIRGYSAWVRKDRSTQGGGVAVYYNSSLGLVRLDTTIPAGLEMVMIKIFGDGGQGTQASFTWDSNYELPHGQP